MTKVNPFSILFSLSRGSGSLFYEREAVDIQGVAVGLVGDVHRAVLGVIEVHGDRGVVNVVDTLDRVVNRHVRAGVHIHLADLLVISSRAVLRELVAEVIAFLIEYPLALDRLNGSEVVLALDFGSGVRTSSLYFR